jgi:excisionase family DNA binding protein
MKLYTIKEAAEILLVERQTIIRKIEEGRLKAINVGSGKKKTYRISEEALNDFINS